jgi:hypothetical protein
MYGRERRVLLRHYLEQADQGMAVRELPGTDHARVLKAATACSDADLANRVFRRSCESIEKRLGIRRFRGGASGVCRAQGTRLSGQATVAIYSAPRPGDCRVSNVAPSRSWFERS